MDDIGNLVYILVFIIWFLYRTFGKGGKKPTRPMPPIDQGAPPPDSGRNQGPTESTPPPVTFEDILRELTGAPPATPERQPEIVEEDVPDRYEEYYPEEEETKFEVLEPQPQQAPITSDSTKFKEFEIKTERSSLAARQAFKMMKSKQGARQAFILKEIFDRKY